MTEVSFLFVQLGATFVILAGVAALVGYARRLGQEARRLSEVVHCPLVTASLEPRAQSPDHVVRAPW